MKKFLISLALVALIATPTFAIDSYHIFFIDQKESANIGGVDYDFWSVTIDGTDYYLMEPGDPRPEGYTVRNIVSVLASAGGYDLLYFITTNLSVALKATEAAEFAGAARAGSGQSFRIAQSSAYLTFAFLSFTDQAGHAPLAIGAAAKLVFPCQWLDVSDEWQSGTFGEWIAAGHPIKGFHCSIPLDVFTD